VGDVGQRFAAPPAEPVVQKGQRVPIVADEEGGGRYLAGVVEPVDVYLVGCGVQDVGGGTGLDAVGPEDRAQPGHVGLQRVGGRAWRVVAPQDVDERLDREDLVAV
jgi:hypothetical protein